MTRSYVRSHDATEVIVATFHAVQTLTFEKHRRAQNARGLCAASHRGVPGVSGVTRT